MEIIREITERRALRAMRRDPIPEESIRRMLEAASLAPSCFNKQPWRFVAVSGPELEKLKGSLSEGNAWAQAAPAIIAVATKPSLDCRLDEGRDYALFDTGAATMALLLQGVREGVIAHPIAGFSASKAKSALGIPEDYTLVTLVIVGFASDDTSLLNERQRVSESAPRDRKALSDTAFAQKWP